jgi:uncharacterized membrane protein
MYKKTTLILVILFAFLISVGQAQQKPSSGSTETYEKGIVLSVMPLEQKTIGFVALVEAVKVKLMSGPQNGEIVEILHYVTYDSPFILDVKPGDRVVVVKDKGIDRYHISDFERLSYTYWLVGLFALSLIIAGRFIGFRSLLTIAFSIFVICAWMLPEILNNRISLPILAVGVSSFIGAVSLVAITGWNRKTLAAIVGTTGGVIIAGFLSVLAIDMLHLSGLVKEEALILKVVLKIPIDYKGLLFAGMIIGALGAIIDTNIAIASAIHEIKCVQRSTDFWKLFKSGMNVGYDTMGMMSNTLILAYLGNCLTLIVLIMAAQQDVSWYKFLNTDLVATEIASAIAGSIGIVFAIPLTAVTAAYLMINETLCDDAHFIEK